jgi:hypothetical protein
VIFRILRPLYFVPFRTQISEFDQREREYYHDLALSDFFRFYS